ncbi:uncharacterized protein LOC107372299 [Tetranychus urticae]|nr:uncharacterized protein LOC107372299 [Tetranychus urticae]
MLLIGLTGGIASGKSTVSRYLVEKGVKVIDADLIAHQVTEPGTPAWKKIKDEFGSSILTEEGAINRDELGKIIFQDQEKRKLLNRITHPYIQREIFMQILTAFIHFEHYVVLDLPLLFEVSKFTNLFHKIIVVNVNEQQQIERLNKRNNYSAEEAQLRISSQMPLSEKCRLADYVIDNDETIEKTKEQVDSILNELNTSKAYLKYRFLLLFLLFNLLLFIYVFINRLSRFVKSFQ